MTSDKPCVKDREVMSHFLFFVKTGRREVNANLLWVNFIISLARWLPWFKNCNPVAFLIMPLPCSEWAPRGSINYLQKHIRVIKTTLWVGISFWNRCKSMEKKSFNMTVWWDLILTTCKMILQVNSIYFEIK